MGACDRPLLLDRVILTYQIERLADADNCFAKQFSQVYQDNTAITAISPLRKRYFQRQKQQE